MTPLDHAVAALPRRFQGPGGACAVIQDGAVVVRHAWGFANAERRISFTPGTLVRMCSVTKQFTCALVLDAIGDPAALDGAVQARLPLLEQAPGALALCHNQSGLRDYWAVAMLHGAPAESAFGDAEAAQVIGGTRSLHFAPGTRYSYTNQNFRLLSDVVAERTGRSFGELLRTRLFDRAGMPSALLAADTAALPDGTEGYEGTQASGFRPAVNRVLWTGDAGLGASLDDMIAWERFIQASAGDAGSLYGRLAAPVRFADGAEAGYGYGLARGRELGRAAVGHGGALRGWRSHRVFLPGERLSAIVLFNHMGDAHAAAVDLLAAALGEHPPADVVEAAADGAEGAPPGWLGAYLEPQTGLSALVEAAGPGRVQVRYDRRAELLALSTDGAARGAGVVLRPGLGGLWMDRPGDNQSSVLRPVDGAGGSDVAGRYRCAELDATVDVVDAGGALYGAFGGFLGRGRMEALDPAGRDVWRLPCPRALDHTPPGDWTLAFRREGGRVTGVTVGCWLARGLWYERIG